jgi:serine/threonine protein phosphatase PrpC
MSDDWSVIGQSVIGTGHVRQQLPCQDAWKSSVRAATTGLGLTVACVADGAGSVAHAASGAQLVVGLTTHWLLDNYFDVWQQSQDVIAARLIRYLSTRMRRVASRLQTPFSSLATTLIAVAVDSENNWLALHLGDGGIIARREDDLRILSGPHKGEFVNETFFVTDADAVQQLRVVSSLQEASNQAESGFLLFTDGLEASLINSRTNAIAPAAGTILDWVTHYPARDVTAALAANIKQLFQSHTDDDCTLVAVANNRRCPGSNLVDAATRS